MNPIPTPAPIGSPFKEDGATKTPEAEKVITVEVVTHTHLDGVLVLPGQTHKISVKQWRALSRHFKFISGPDEHDPKSFNPPTRS